MSDTPRSGYGQALLLGLGSFALYGAWSVYGAFVPLLYRNLVPGLALIGMLMVIDNVMAVTLQPWVGTRSDRTRAGGGPRRLYVVAGLVTAALGFAAIPVAAHASLGALVTATVVANLGICLFRAPLAALLSDLFPLKVRAPRAGLVNLVGSAGGLAALLGGGLLYGLAMPAPFLAVAGCLLVAALAIGIGVREPGATRLEEPVPASHGLRASASLLRGPDGRGLALFLVGVFCVGLAFSGRSTWFTTYATGALGLSGGAAAALLTPFALACILGSWPAGTIAARVGRRQAIVLGLVPLAPIYLACLATRDPAAIAALQGLAGLCWPLFWINGVLLAQEFGGPQQAGFLSGLYILSFEAAQIIGPPLIGFVMELFGPATLWLVVGVGMALGAICIAVVRSPSAAGESQRAVPGYVGSPPEVAG